MVDRRGRPRSFDIEQTLEQALVLFWQHGYLGTSYTDICLATGLNKPSLYAALGNKEETFISALDMYVARYVQPGIIALEREPNAQKAVWKLLIATVGGLTSKSTPPGCFIASNASCADTPQVPEVVGAALRTAAAQTRMAINTRLESALVDTQLPPGTDVGALTCFYDTLIAGLSGLAKQGAEKKDLTKAIDIAMRVWPG